MTELSVCCIKTTYPKSPRSIARRVAAELVEHFFCRLVNLSTRTIELSRRFIINKTFKNLIWECFTRKSGASVWWDCLKVHTKHPGESIALGFLFCSFFHYHVEVFPLF